MAAKELGMDIERIANDNDGKWHVTVKKEIIKKPYWIFTLLFKNVFFEPLHVILVVLEWYGGDAVIYAGYVSTLLGER